VTSVLLVSVLLGLSGLLAYRAVQRMERAATTVASLDPGPWREVSADIRRVSDELAHRVGDRIDR
jgi:hypothetical protein